MTEETELKIEQLTALAEKIEMGEEFRSIVVTAMAFLTSQTIEEEQLKFFLTGYSMGSKSGYINTEELKE